MLYHNNGNGTFTDVSAKAGIAQRRRQRARRRVRRFRRRWFDRHLRRQRLGAVRSCIQNNGDGTFTEVGAARRRRIQRGREDLRRHGRRLRRLRQRRMARYHRHRSFRTALHAFPQQRRRQFPRRDERVRRSAAPRCRIPAGARASSTTTTTAGKTSSSRRDTSWTPSRRPSPNLSYLQPPLLLRNESGRFSRVDAGDVFQTSVGRPRRRFRRPGQRRRHRHRASATSGRSRTCCAMTAATQNGWMRIRTRGTQIESRRHRLPGEGRLRVRPDPILHRQYRGRISVGER